MVIRSRDSRGVRVVGSAGLAVVVATGLVITAPQGHHWQVETRHVDLTAIMLSAVVNDAGSSAASSTAGPLGSPGSAMIASDGTVRPAPAAAAEDDFWASPIGTVLIAVNFLLLPLWFLATPITLPLAMVVAAGQVTVDGPLGTVQFLIALGLGFLTGPLGLIAPFIQNSASPAAAEAPAAARGGSAEGLAPESAVTAPGVGASATDRSRGRLAARQTGVVPRAAAARAVTSSASSPTSIDGSADETLDGGQASAPISAAEPVLTAPSDEPSGKARAMSRSRR